MKILTAMGLCRLHGMMESWNNGTRMYPIFRHSIIPIVSEAK